MNRITNQELQSAKNIVGPLPAIENIDDHEHNADCMEIETVEITSFATPDVDTSYDREIYVCKVTGEDIDLFEADPLQDRAEAQGE